MMASAQVVETSVYTNNSPSQDYTTNPDDHSNHNIDSPGFKTFTVIATVPVKTFLNLKARQPNYLTHNGTNAEEEIHFKNREKKL